MFTGIIEDIGVVEAIKKTDKFLQLSIRSKNILEDLNIEITSLENENYTLNNVKLRYEDEPIRHKVLDVIGDLHLSGHSILGHFKGEKSGHEINNILLKKIFANKSSFTLVNMTETEKDQVEDS